MMHLAIQELLKKYETNHITMNCLGGFTAGKLEAYPCLGFMQLLNDGGEGVCEGMDDDAVSMILARLLTGRPGYVSDPAVDTSKNLICYSHCVGSTRMFGPARAPNPYHLLTLHNRDPRGACAQSFMPADYLTTTFQVKTGRKELVMHQAQSVGNLETDFGCRTKLAAELHGDMEKLIRSYAPFGWHRVTVYGDLKGPLKELAKALKLKVVEEA